MTSVVCCVDNTAVSTAPPLSHCHSRELVLRSYEVSSSLSFRGPLSVIPRSSEESFSFASRKIPHSVRNDKCGVLCGQHGRFHPTTASDCHSEVLRGIFQLCQ